MPAQGLHIASVLNHEIGPGSLFGIGNLAGEPDAGVAGGCFAGRAGLGDTGGVASNLDVVGRSEDDDVIEAPAPVGKNSCLLAAGAGVTLHFEDQG